MSTGTEFTGKSLDEALFRALKQLDKRPDEIRYEILTSEAGEVRLLVMDRNGEIPSEEPPQVETRVGSEIDEPIVEGPVTSETVAQTAQQILRGLLDAMSVRGEVAIREHGTDSDEVLSATLDILGEDLGVLIGRRGETLRALQFIIRLMVGKRLQTWARVNVDVEHYQARREETLRDLATRMAERVQSTGELVTLEAMSPRERRIIHMALRDNPYVTTKSHGDEGDRTVVISPVSAP